MLMNSEKKDINNDYDIMIIGGGPSGLSTLMHLQQNAPELASRCILIEKEKYPRQKICGGAVGGWAENILNNLNIKLKINLLMIDIVECNFGNKKYTLNERNYFRMVDRKEFDYFLAKEAIKKGLKINQNEKFIDFKRDGKNITVETDKNKYNVKVLVGADGSLSKIRNKINIHNGKLAPAFEIILPIVNQYGNEFHGKKVIFDFTPIKSGIDGYIWHFPCLIDKKPYMNHGMVNFIISQNSFKINMKKIFLDSLEKRNIENLNMSLLGHPIRCYLEKDNLSEKNVLLIGDAAGIESATGGGIHLALSYGELAANSIIHSFKTNNFLFNNYKDDFNNSLTGRYIKKLSILSNQIYSKKKDPLSSIEKIFVK